MKEFNAFDLSDENVEAIREYFYEKHGFTNILPVPVDVFIQDFGFCISSKDDEATAFEPSYFTVKLRAKDVTINSLSPSHLKRFFLAMAFWYILAGLETRTMKFDELACTFAKKFLLPLNAIDRYLKQDDGSCGIIDFYLLMDAPSFLIDQRYEKTQAYDEMFERMSFHYRGI